MIFEKGRQTRYNFTYDNVQLDVVDSFKYLGIHFFKNCNWNRTEKMLVQHSYPALHKLFIVFNQLNLSISDRCKLFDSLVGSILHYGAEVWGNYKGKSIESVHCKFIRKILCVKKSTNLDGLYGEVGRYPMQVQRKLIMIRYWIKILNSPDSIPKQIYCMLKEDVDNNRFYNNMNWAYHIKYILDEIGMSDIWIQQYNVNINFTAIKERIIDIYKQNWYANLSNSSKLSSYSLYKRNLCMESYLNFINVDKFRIAFTKFRLSSHDLAIETGRYTNIERNLKHKY